MFQPFDKTNELKFNKTGQYVSSASNLGNYYNFKAKIQKGKEILKGFNLRKEKSLSLS